MDALGSPVAETDAAGAVIKRSAGQPWGVPASGSYEQGPGYTGHVTDALTGLSYMQQRYYDPVAGRFLSVDPIAASEGSFNRYWYANNNPHRNIDPDGRRACGKDTTCRLENGERGSSTAVRYTAHNTRSTGFGRQNAPTQELQRAMESTNSADRQKAADAAVSTFGIKSKATYNGPYYDSDLRDNGLTQYNGGITVSVGPSAYRSWSFLGYVLSHEIEVHVGQFAVMRALGHDFSKGYNLREVEAYRYNLRPENIRRFGNTPDEVQEMQERLDFYKAAAGLK